MRARIALARWAMRMVRQEWREHVLVIALIATGITAATLLVASTGRLKEPPEAQIEAPAVVEFFDAGPSDASTSEPAASSKTTLEAALTEVATNHPALELQASSASDDNGIISLMADPTAPLGASRFSLREGAWPTDGEVALTRPAIVELAARSDTSPAIGDTVEFAGVERRLAGVWENPFDIRRRSALLTPDETAVAWDRARVLAPSDTGADIDALLAISPDNGERAIDSYLLTPESISVSNGVGTSTMAYLGGTLLCLQIAILASAGFTVLAQRRTRQLGMLSAMGAAPRKVGSVMSAAGLVCGLLGGVIGLAVGVVVSILTTPLIQSAASHRLDALDLPWSTLVGILPLAVLTALAAAWWPARRVARNSTSNALAARRPPETGLTRSLPLGLLLLMVGTGLIIFGAPKNDPVPIIAGAIALTGGALLMVPAIVSILGAAAGAMPLAVRIAWRDVNRNRARSSAAVGAAAMGLAIPFGIASFAASLQASLVPNVAPDSVVLQAHTETGFFQYADEAEAAELFAPFLDAAPDARLVPVLSVVDRSATEDFRSTNPDIGEEVITYHAMALRQSGTSNEATAIATPELLEAMDLGTPDEGTQIVSMIDSDIELPGAGSNLAMERGKATAEAYPTVLLVGDVPGIDTSETFVSSWFLVNDVAFSDDEYLELERIARTEERISVTTPSAPAPFLTIRVVALTVAGLIALGVVAVSVALIRTESSSDTRALNAVGASPRTARAIGAATAWGLTATAVAVAVPASFLALSGVYLNPDEQFDFTVPWLELGIIVVVVPLLAALGAWLTTSTRATGMHLRH